VRLSTDSVNGKKYNNQPVTCMQKLKTTAVRQSPDMCDKIQNTETTQDVQSIQRG